MPSGEEMWLSRMIEKVTSGSLGGGWKRGGPVGHLRVLGRCAMERHHDGLVRTQPTDRRYRASPRPDLALGFRAAGFVLKGF